MGIQETKDIGMRLVAFCRENKDREALETLYADHATSIEAVEMSGGGPREFKGLDQIRGKHDWWEKTMEVHEFSVHGPYYHGEDRFGVIFDVDASNRESGERSAMRELGIYTVADGKIVSEEFFYEV
ncbi:MAG: nuclear transport factor 2 family protein [Pseudomonadota bacterium]